MVEIFLGEHALDAIVSGFDIVQREVNLGISKLDFKVGDTYLEVKMPLTTINVKYGKDIKTLPPKPISSTDRMVKHLKELAGSLKEHEKAVFLRVFQYRMTEKKERLRSTHYEEVSQTFTAAAATGVEFWEVQMDFRPEGGNALQRKQKYRLMNSNLIGWMNHISGFVEERHAIQNDNNGRRSFSDRDIQRSGI